MSGKKPKPGLVELPLKYEQEIVVDRGSGIEYDRARVTLNSLGEHGFRVVGCVCCVVGDCVHTIWTMERERP